MSLSCGGSHPAALLRPLPPVAGLAPASKGAELRPPPALSAESHETRSPGRPAAPIHLARPALGGRPLGVPEQASGPAAAATRALGSGLAPGRPGAWAAGCRQQGRQESNATAAAPPALGVPRPGPTCVAAGSVRGLTGWTTGWEGPARVQGDDSKPCRNQQAARCVTQRERLGLNAALTLWKGLGKGQNNVFHSEGNRPILRETGL